ncbi:MAG: RdgB/HAM1 family non-canonical purine NTP pyrophosphatase [Ignavibacteriaceae bacterium]
MKRKIILASKNQGKIREVKKIIDGAGIELVSLLELNDLSEIDETGTTFEENAKIKAVEVYNKYKIPAIGDDSGLSVEQLFSAPGVYSARYAGPGANDDDNNRKLLRELEKFKEPHYAKYTCCVVYFDGENYTVTEGEVEGIIIKEPRGNNGFGYDPFFVPVGYERTMGELALDEKNKISHRSKAFNNLKNALKL